MAGERKGGRGSVSVALAGMMGCGKTAAGRRLAEILAVEFVDTDRLIETRCGCSIAELFARDGEGAFRELERSVVTEIEGWAPTVVALGGGMFVGSANVERLRDAAFTVWLRAQPATLLARLGATARATRPLLDTPDPEARLTGLLAAREPWYRRAHAIVDVDRLTVEETARAIATLLECPTL